MAKTNLPKSLIKKREDTKKKWIETRYITSYLSTTKIIKEKKKNENRNNNTTTSC